jgi:hypothetical protein
LELASDDDDDDGVELAKIATPVRNDELVGDEDENNDEEYDDEDDDEEMDDSEGDSHGDGDIDEDDEDKEGEEDSDAKVHARKASKKAPSKKKRKHEDDTWPKALPTLLDRVEFGDLIEYHCRWGKSGPMEAHSLNVLAGEYGDRIVSKVNAYDRKAKVDVVSEALLDRRNNKGGDTEYLVCDDMGIPLRLTLGKTLKC